MKSIDIVSKIVAREGEAKASPSKGIQSINLSDYLLKSVWDKVFEVRTDSQGTEYIFGKLPMVTQYGITMYSGDDVNVPSIASGLPFDGRTIWYNPDTQQIEVIGGTGGGSGEGVSNFWDLSGIPSWITNSKPAYSYSEITGAISTTELQNYLTSNSYINVAGGDNRYLQLSGGTIKSDAVGLTIKRTTQYPIISFYGGDTSSQSFYGALGFGGGNTPIYVDNTGSNTYNLWHAGNDGSDSGLDADLLDGQHGEWHRNNVTAFARTNYTSTQTHDANVCITGMMYNYGSLSYWKNTPDMSYGQILTLRSYGSNELMGQLAWDIRHGESDTTRYLWWRGIQNESRISSAKWHQIAFTDSNVASASKLLSGVGNVDGHLYMYNQAAIYMNDNTGTPRKVMSMNGDNLLLIGEQPTNYTTVIDGESIHLRAKDFVYGLYVNSFGSVGIKTTSPNDPLHVVGDISTYAPSNNPTASINFANSVNDRWQISGRFNKGSSTDNDRLNVYYYNGSAWATHTTFMTNGNIGFGVVSPLASLHVYNKNYSTTGLIIDGGWSGYGFLYNGFSIYLNGEPWGGLGVNTVTSAYGSTSAAGVYITNAKSGEYMNFYNEGGVFLKSNLLVNGGITMYSDQRKKTILNHVELSLKQIADAPLIEHYYNSDESKTTHVGSIAQYWANMNDWFCKLDSEGYYTMEIQNAALASAISIARELNRYETKTDKAIKKLKMRICELEEEVERLKSA